MGLKARGDRRQRTAAPAATARKTDSAPRRSIEVEWNPQRDGSGEVVIAYAGLLATRDTVLVRAGTWRQGGERWAELQQLELTRGAQDAWTGVIPIRAGLPLSALEFVFRAGDEWDNGGQAPLGYYEWSTQEGRISVR